MVENEKTKDVYMCAGEDIFFTTAKAETSSLHICTSFFVPAHKAGAFC